MKWWERRNLVLTYVSKLEKTCKDLNLKLQRKLSKQEQVWQEKIQEVQESFKEFLKDWPDMHFHSMGECMIPKHPACIQYLQSPPQIEPPEGLKDKIPRTELQSLVLNVDVVLANSTEFECTSQFKELIMKEVDKARGVRQQLECMLESIQLPEGSNSTEAIENGVSKEDDESADCLDFTGEERSGVFSILYREIPHTEIIVCHSSTT